MNKKIAFLIEFVITLLLSFVLVSCGSKAKDPVSSQLLSERLEQSANRVRENLLVCRGLASKPNCNVDDGLGITGYYRVERGDKGLDDGVRAAIRGDGRPFRSSWHVQNDTSKTTFSRDHMLSLAFWTIGSRDAIPLRKVMGYAKTNGYTVCPHQNCVLTPAVLDIVGDAVKYVDGARPENTNWPNGVIEQTALLEANSLTGYALVLVVDKAFLKALTGNLTSVWHKVATIAAERNPDNLYFQYVSEYTNGGRPEVYMSIAEKLIVKLDDWKQPGTCNTFSHKCEDSTGWELVSLADWLLKSNAFYGLE